MNALWIAQRVLREVLRDRRTVAFFFLVPVAVMVLVYIALAKDEVARVAVVSRGMARSLAEPLAAALAQAGGVRSVPLPALEPPPGPGDPEAGTNEPDLERKILDALRREEADAIVLLPASLVPERLAGRLPHDGGKDAPLQRLEDGRVAEELGDVDEKVLGEGAGLGGILLQHPEVLIEIAGLLQNDPPFHPA